MGIIQSRECAQLSLSPSACPVKVMKPKDEKTKTLATGYGAGAFVGNAGKCRLVVVPGAKSLMPMNIFTI